MRKRPMRLRRVRFYGETSFPVNPFRPPAGLRRAVFSHKNPFRPPRRGFSVQAKSPLANPRLEKRSSKTGLPKRTRKVNKALSSCRNSFGVPAKAQPFAAGFVGRRSGSPTFVPASATRRGATEGLPRRGPLCRSPIKFSLPYPRNRIFPSKKAAFQRLKK